ncbi:MAG: GNAT family N-acetyltransferase [Cyanobacteria bacterium J06643_4]
MQEPLFIRPATLADRDALLRLSINSFRDTFADENNTDDINRYLKETFSVAKMEAELKDTRNTFLLAFTKADNALMGYGKLHNGTPEKEISGLAPIEISRLYLDSAFIGRGLGSKLMQACLDEATKQGCQTVWLGVWEHNIRALRFYRRWGFEVVGSHIFQMGTDAQTDLIMERSIASDA